MFAGCVKLARVNANDPVAKLARGGRRAKSRFVRCGRSNTLLEFKMLSIEMIYSLTVTQPVLLDAFSLMDQMDDLTDTFIAIHSVC